MNTDPTTARALIALAFTLAAGCVALVATIAGLLWLGVAYP